MPAGTRRRVRVLRRERLRVLDRRSLPAHLALRQTPCPPHPCAKQRARPASG
ncbi:hypothetical protein SHJG_4511 [Streptomyces hygroscopicus subsp. jinggangensis 5008]|nr:hypothetical protein SHJG_4511 [Streptomyces hygroscopicus subsp. jinggangensis 5008]